MRSLVRLCLALSTAIVLTGCQHNAPNVTPKSPESIFGDNDVTIKAQPKMTMAPVGHAAYVRLDVHVVRNELNHHLRVEVREQGDGGLGIAARASETDLDGERAIASFQFEFYLDPGDYVARAMVTRSNGDEKIATDTVKVIQ